MRFECRLFEYIGLTEDNGEGVRWAQYRDSEGTIYHFADLPFGAMFIDSTCAAADCKGVQRGGCLHVKVPSRADGTGDGQFWQVDHPMSQGPYWDRLGAPPEVTANPSILTTGGYHAWLISGQLVNV